MSKGVNVIYHEDESITIELHIIVENGVNIPAVCRSIMNEVRYVSGSEHRREEVRSVDVFVDSMILSRRASEKCMRKLPARCSSG